MSFFLFPVILLLSLMVSAPASTAFQEDQKFDPIEELTEEKAIEYIYESLPKDMGIPGLSEKLAEPARRREAVKIFQAYKVRKMFHRIGWKVVDRIKLPDGSHFADRKGKGENPAFSWMRGQAYSEADISELTRTVGLTPHPSAAQRAKEYVTYFLGAETVKFYMGVAVVEYWNCFTSGDPTLCRAFHESLLRPSTYIGFTLFTLGSGAYGAALNKVIQMSALGKFGPGLQTHNIFTNPAFSHMGMAAGMFVSDFYHSIIEHPKITKYYQAAKIEDPIKRAEVRDKLLEEALDETLTNGGWWYDKLPDLASLIGSAMVNHQFTNLWKQKGINIAKGTILKFSKGARAIGRYGRPAAKISASTIRALEGMQALSTGIKVTMKAGIALGPIDLILFVGGSVIETATFVAISGYLGTHVKEIWSRDDFEENVSYAYHALQKEIKTIPQVIKNWELNPGTQELHPNLYSLTHAIRNLQLAWDDLRAFQLSEPRNLNSRYSLELNDADNLYRRINNYYGWFATGMNRMDPVWQSNDLGKKQPGMEDWEYEPIHWHPKDTNPKNEIELPRFQRPMIGMNLNRPEIHQNYAVWDEVRLMLKEFFCGTDVFQSVVMKKNWYGRKIPKLVDLRVFENPHPWCTATRERKEEAKGIVYSWIDQGHLLRVDFYESTSNQIFEAAQFYQFRETLKKITSAKLQNSTEVERRMNTSVSFVIDAARVRQEYNLEEEKEQLAAEARNSTYTPKILPEFDSDVLGGVRSILEDYTSDSRLFSFYVKTLLAVALTDINQLKAEITDEYIRLNKVETKKALDYQSGFSTKYGLRFRDSGIESLKNEQLFWMSLDKTLGVQYGIDSFMVPIQDTESKIKLAEHLLRFSQELEYKKRLYPAKQNYARYGTLLASYTYEKSPVKQWNHLIDDLIVLFVGGGDE